MRLFWIRQCKHLLLYCVAELSISIRLFPPNVPDTSRGCSFFSTCACILLACGNSFLTWIVLLTSAKIFSFVLLFCSNHHDNSINVIGLGRKTCTAAYNQSCYSLHFSTCCLLRMRKFLVFTNTLVNAQQTHTLLLC